MTWVYLLLAGMFEVVWATTLKLSQGFTNLWYGGSTVVGMVLSFIFLSMALKHMPLSLAYSVWTGIGAVGSIIVGVVLFKDAIPGATWVFIVMLIIGLIGIKVTSGY